MALFEWEILIQFYFAHTRFRIKVSGRLKQYINAFGEEVIADNAVIKLLRLPAEKTGLVGKKITLLHLYTFGDHSKGAHEWLIEFEQAPASTDAVRI